MGKPACRWGSCKIVDSKNPCYTIIIFSLLTESLEHMERKDEKPYGCSLRRPKEQRRDQTKALASSPATTVTEPTPTMGTEAREDQINALAY